MDTSELKAKSEVTKYIVDVDEIMKRIDLHSSFDSRQYVTKAHDNNFGLVMKEFRDGVTKCCEAVCAPCDPCKPTEMQPSDIRLVINLVKALQDVGSDKIARPKELEDREFINTLPAESFVLDLDSKLMPHHNVDFSINKKWLDYQLSTLLSGDYTRLGASDFNIAVNHLYHHYQEETMKKSAKDVVKTEEAKAEGLKDVTPVAPVISNDEVELMGKCYNFYVNKNGDRPQVNGNDLSDVEVRKIAEAYRAMMQRKRERGSLGLQMADKWRTAATATMPAGATDGQVAVNKSLSTNDNNMQKVEKNTDEVKDTPEVTPEVEATVDTSVEKTVDETTPETTPAVETPKVEGEQPTVEAKVEETPEDVTKSTEDGEEEDVDKAAPVTP